MDIESTRQRFIDHLSQLLVIIEKIPPNVFEASLAPNMFNLAMNAKIATNFTLRGLCPLINEDTVDFMEDSNDKQAVTNQIIHTKSFIASLTMPECIMQNKIIEKAGHREVVLTPDTFLEAYIIPNYFFHVSMVYAIARANNVELSKGDFDGYHQYPVGFSFV